MTATTILTILGIVNGLLTVAKDAPAVVEEARSLIAKVQPHVDGAGEEVKSAFSAVQAQLANL